MARRILIVDDLAANRLILKKLLGADYDTVEAENGYEALRVLQHSYKSISAILLDIVMPVMDGYETLRSIRQNPLWSHLPVVIVTGTENESDRVKAISLGANDFITKPYHPDLVKHSLRNAIQLRETASILNAIQKDKLTGLYNRECFFEKAAEIIQSHDAGAYVMACMDIDNFKLINDQYGAAEGDRILKHVGAALGNAYDHVGGVSARISGDNFAGLYPNTPEAIQYISEHASVNCLPEDVPSTLSAAVGRCVVTDTSLPASALYDRAFIAKQTIKGRFDRHVAWFDDSMLESLLAKQEISGNMENSLENGEFEVWFQPQYNHATGALIGAEALVRWRHPEKGIIPPGGFIPVFEQNGFVYELDKFVWEEACRYLRKWLGEGRNALPVSVNISRFDVFKADLIDVLTGLLEKYALPMELLRLEITESAFSKSTDQITAVIKALIAAGFTVEIDDFGSGYSSLNTLKDVPAQILKLDMRFLETSENSDRGGNILESVVRMAKWLGMSVIAEGVETEAQADFLKSIGCNYVQGYLYAKPMPAEDYEALAKGHGKEREMLLLETVDKLDNNRFWDPKSMDSLIFNSYVGGACIVEYHDGKAEMLRINDRFKQEFHGAAIGGVSVCDMGADNCMDAENLRIMNQNRQNAIATGKESVCEVRIYGLDGEPGAALYMRFSQRAIARAGDRYLLYTVAQNITKQREAEQKEHALAERLQVIMDKVYGGVSAVTISDDGKISYLFANDRYYQILGYTRAQFEAEVPDPMALILPGDRTKTRETIRTLLRERTPALFEYRCTRRDGVIVYIRCSGSVTKLEGVKDDVLIGILTDITEIKNAESQFVFLNEMSHEVLAQPDAEMGINSILHNLLGYFDSDRAYIVEFDRQKGEASNTYEACAEGVRSEMERLQNVPFDVLAYWNKAFASQDYIDIADVDALPDDRPEKEILQSQNIKSLCAVPLRRDGEVIGFVGVDDTHRNHSEIGRLAALGDYLCVLLTRRDYDAKIAQNNAALAQMLEDMPGGYVKMRIVESGVVPIFINDEFCRIIGMTHDETMRMYAADAYAGVHPDDIERVKKTINEGIKNRTTISLRVRLSRLGGGYVPMQVFYRVTEDADGHNLCGYYSDASEQEKLERKRDELLDNLPAGAALYTYDGKHLKALHLNQHYWLLVGREPNADTPDSFLDAVYPGDVPTVLQELAAAIRQKRDFSCDIRVLHGDGGYHPFHVNACIVKQPGGEHLIYATYTPISDEVMSVQARLPILLSAIMENSSDLAFAKDSDFRYICASESFAEMCGLAAARDVIGKTDYELFDCEMADKFRHDDKALFEGGASLVDLSDRFPFADGTLHDYSTSRYLLRDSGGGVIGLYGIGRDITEYRNTAERLATLTETIPGGIATFDVSPAGAHILYFNEGFYRFSGLTREEYAALAAQDPLFQVFEEDRPAALESIFALLKEGVDRSAGSYRCHTEDGYRWYSITGVVSQRHGDSVIVNAVKYDVTAQQEALARLRQSEEEYRLAMKHTGNVICRFTVADRTLTMPPEVAALRGLPERVLNMPQGMLTLGKIAPESEKTYSDFYEDIVRGKNNGSMIFRSLLPIGWRYLEGSYSTVFDSGGKPDFAVVSFIDTTERVEQEAIVRKWRQSIESRRPESYSLFCCNLSKDASYDTEAGALMHGVFDAVETLSFNARVKRYVERRVVPDDQKRYTEFVNADTMLAAYYRGKRADSLEYRETRPDGAERWLRLSIELVEHPHSNDIMAYMLYEDIDEEKQSELQRKHEAETDTLTGVLNRKAFAERMNLLLQTKRDKSIFALFMLDLDGFKQINDSFGHAVGDEALIEVGHKLKAALRSGDLVGRLGGDEFVVCLCELPSLALAGKKAKQLCARLHKTFSLETQLSVSIGVAVCPDDGSDFDTLYHKADIALYHVKATGKDDFAFYSDEMGEETPPAAISACGRAGTAESSS